ncbi:hypothetical protein LP032_101 [Listeria phage LP-032]|uniref:Uncharacterized protein n=5 Tax=Homburgvirus TaxID=1921125 RepID=A0A5A4K1I1_9CAUD|nr:hypothetical protein P70_0085 [Listeria phage P70]YP_008240393.1 hypothetical protein LP110_029 [Listeria phage LP-110]YP_009044149.1 hypothetical protein LP026_064 [Listeria phage LP-026]AHL18950.1 hypothetical protein LP032_101 [Listeria phage LP-032]AWY07723.1 hypothetical protein [Listeria phage LP-KV022]AFQ96274.1 hypothetical protein P70_0085 [Listeria phage P70]AGI11532.1 hypothetical protein LP110_029 [Listeria phage LP-110]AHN84758.1 hypothetical protein LP026_064 [Listeria phage
MTAEELINELQTMPPDTLISVEFALFVEDVARVVYNEKDGEARIFTI